VEYDNWEPQFKPAIPDSTDISGGAVAEVLSGTTAASLVEDGSKVVESEPVGDDDEDQEEDEDD
jgi:hypothetical protein